MPRSPASGCACLLLLVMLRTMMVVEGSETSRTGGSRGQRDASRIEVDDVWTSADAIHLSIHPHNISDHRILVSVQQEDNSSTIVVDTLPEQTKEDLEMHLPIEHTMEELTPDTRYELCVALSGRDNSPSNAEESECYKVKTFPRVNNTRGLYAALASTAVFLIVCGAGWILYRKCLGNYLKKIYIDDQDGQQDEHAMEVRSTANPSQVTTDIESTTTPTQ